MGTSVISGFIEKYENDLCDNKVKKTIEVFNKLKNSIAGLINDTLKLITTALDKDEQYKNMIEEVRSFTVEIKGRYETVPAKVGEYNVGSKNSEEIITAEKLKTDYEINEDSLSRLNTRITEAEKELEAKQDYYETWVGPNTKQKGLISLAAKYDYDQNESLKLANVLKRLKITQNLTSQGDNEYLSLGESLKETESTDDKKQAASVKLTNNVDGDKIEIELKRKEYYVDDKLLGVNLALDKLKKYNLFCKNVYNSISECLYSTEKEGSFVRNVNNFFGESGRHGINKKNLDEKNAEQKKHAELANEIFIIERLEDYYYKEDSNERKYFPKFGKERANDYDKKLDERKNFIKSFCEYFENSCQSEGKTANIEPSKLFNKMGDIEKLNKLGKDESQSEEENGNNNENGNSNGNVDLSGSIEKDEKDRVFIDIGSTGITDIRIKWNAIFTARTQTDEKILFPWKEEWETKTELTVDNMKISYPKAFAAIDQEFETAVKWLTETLKEDIKTLDQNIQTLKARRDEIDTKLKEWRQAEAEEEARRQAEAEEEARRQAEAEEEARRQAEADAIRDAMSGGGEE